LAGSSPASQFTWLNLSLPGEGFRFVYNGALFDCEDTST